MTSSDKPIDFDQSEPIPLDPIILRARDELLEKYSDKSFEEQITFYKAVIEGEKDSLARLSAMAARVYILRKRLALLAGNLMEDQLDELSNKQSGFDLDSSLTEISDVKDPEVIGNDKSWMRLRIVDSSEVNGVRFPAGVVIDVKREDGEKLIESGKADFISTEESRQFKSEEGLEEANNIVDTSENEQSNDILEENVNDKEIIINREDIILETKKIDKDLLGNFPSKPLRIGTINKGGQGERIYSTNGTGITLSAYGGGPANKTGAYLVDGKIRKLTLRECARMMGFPENFKICNNKTQAYTQFGNAVIVNVVQFIINDLIKKNFLST